MHNLLLTVIQAESASDADSRVERTILHWGNENNWRAIGGVASENGTVDIVNLSRSGYGLDFLDDPDDMSGGRTYFERTVTRVLAAINDLIFPEALGQTASCDFQSALRSIADQIVAFNINQSSSYDLLASSQNVELFFQIHSARQELKSVFIFVPLKPPHLKLPIEIRTSAQKELLKNLTNTR